MKTSQLLLATLLLGLGLSLCVEDKFTSPHQSYTYDSAQQVTVSGKVQDVKEYQCRVSGTGGAHIVVKAENGTFEVHLAPIRFMKDYEIAFRTGDEVKITGAKIMFEGKPALMAKTVVVGNNTFMFRDPDGKPLW